MSRIGIIGAMEEEIELLKNEMQLREVKELANMLYYIGSLGSKEIVLVRCGIGKVNAAICTQVLIGQLEVTHVINTGVAGAIHESLNVLDVVISTEVQQHDFDVTGFGYPIGVIPRMECSVFPASEQLVTLAQGASKEVLKEHQVLSGKIVSGDVFVSSSELKEKIWSQFQGLCTEMEGAAIGHTCFVNGIPFVIIRAMSDRADGSAHDNFNEFVNQAAIHSKQIVKRILDEME